MSDMVEVQIDSIRVSLMSQQRIVILRERSTERYLPIWIGVYEAESITIALQEVAVARPLTHDLIKNILKEFQARVIRVEVVSMREDTYFGNIVVEMNDQILNIDSRPSDALAIAVRTHVPIFVARSVMTSVGIVPETDLQEEAPEQPAAPLAPPPTSEEDSGQDRLSIFQDFLEKLDLEDLDKDKPDDTPEK
jgi:uncharacterized protein